MHKLDNGITMHDPKKCIGCRYCMFNCPYGVIHFNWQKAHKVWMDGEALIKDCTPSPLELTEKLGEGKAPPYFNPARGETLPVVRPKGVVEKCTFCDHRLRRGQLPYCVEACPADARIFGDLEDPGSDVSVLLGKFRPFRLKEELGTEPNVYYIRNFNPAAYERTKGGV
jgi:molybdopterin-containing oxidoreductase family iron-sulfur binding subunit